MNRLQNTAVRWLDRCIAPTLKREEGQTLVEYALILIAIAVVVATVVYTLGGRVVGVFTTITNAI